MNVLVLIFLPFRPTEQPLQAAHGVAGREKISASILIYDKNDLEATSLPNQSSGSEGLDRLNLTQLTLGGSTYAWVKAFSQTGFA